MRSSMVSAELTPHGGEVLDQPSERRSRRHQPTQGSFSGHTRHLPDNNVAVHVQKGFQNLAFAAGADQLVGGERRDRRRCHGGYFSPPALAASPHRSGFWSVRGTPSAPERAAWLGTRRHQCPVSEVT